MWQCGKPHQTAIEVAWWMDNETFLGKRITSLESRGARNWAYSDYVYVSNIWSRHTFCMFGRRSRVSLLPMTGSLCFWGLYPVAATLRNPSWPSKGPSQWWRESLTLLDGMAKTRALPSESSCYALKTSIYAHLSHLFISIHIIRYYKHYISLLYMSEGFRMCP